MVATVLAASCGYFLLWDGTTRPMGDEERQLLIDTAEQFADECLTKNADIIDFVGTNNSAISSDAVSTAISVIGRYFMNSPMTSGQNASGTNAASVVQVDAMIGQAIRRAALE